MDREKTAFLYEPGTVGGEVERWLVQNGYDGLVNYDKLCCCGLDEIGTCGTMQVFCMAGKRVRCRGERCRVPFCNHDGSDHIVAFPKDPGEVVYDLEDEWWSDEAMPTVGKIVAERAFELGWYLTDGYRCSCYIEDWNPYSCADATCRFTQEEP